MLQLDPREVEARVSYGAISIGIEGVDRAADHGLASFSITVLYVVRAPFARSQPPEGLRRASESLRLRRRATRGGA